jgi:gliding motility-associated-like protein
MLAGLLFTQTLLSQALVCSGDFILTLSQDADSSHFYFVDIGGDQNAVINFNQFSTVQSPYLNAIGYRRDENLIYGIANNSQDLYQVDAIGQATFIQHYDELDAGAAYNAGDITPNGRYLIVLSGETGAGAWRSKSMLLFDLESPEYNLTIIPLVTDSGNEFYSLDIAFDPLSGILYGYDGRYGRLVTIDVNTGDVDDTTFPVSTDIEAMAALFFDSFGNLFGYAKHLNEPGIKALYQIDKTTGSGTFLLEGPLAAASDGCNCPYRIEMLKSVNQPITTTCSEIEYTFTLANTSEILQESVRFENRFPPDFTVLEVIDNPYGGIISGINTNELIIEDMSITPNIDSFKVKVAIGNTAEGIYKSQAALLNLPPAIGYSEISDDPRTIARNDSTRVEVIPLVVPTEVFETLTLCPNSPLVLDATFDQGAFNYTWDDGTAGPLLEITEPGLYEVTAINDCEVVIKTFEAVAVNQSFDLDLGENQILTLGEVVNIDPGLQSGDFIYEWAASNGAEITCSNCPFLSELAAENVVYSLVVTDGNGCVQTDSINIEVVRSYEVFAPNIITPNGDGVNDQFFIQGKSGTQIEQLSIYDRWGTLVFESGPSSDGSNVQYWEDNIPEGNNGIGVFVWVCKVRFIDGTEKVFSGDITLVR